MKQLQFNFKKSELEKRLFKNWLFSMFQDCNSERRIYKETPYKNIYTYYKNNYKYLNSEWENKIKKLSLSNAEIS